MVAINNGMISPNSWSKGFLCSFLVLKFLSAKFSALSEVRFNKGEFLELIPDLVYLQCTIAFSSSSPITSFFLFYFIRALSFSPMGTLSNSHCPLLLHFICTTALETMLLSVRKLWLELRSIHPSLMVLLTLTTIFSSRLLYLYVLRAPEAASC